jgi:hypothetical protein
MAGQVIPPCTRSNGILSCVLCGGGEMTVGNQCARLKSMARVVVLCHAGSRDIVAKTDRVILAVQSVSRCTWHFEGGVDLWLRRCS